MTEHHKALDAYFNMVEREKVSKSEFFTLASSLICRQSSRFLLLCVSSSMETQSFNMHAYNLFEEYGEITYKMPGILWDVYSVLHQWWPLWFFEEGRGGEEMYISPKKCQRQLLTEGDNAAF